MEPESTDAPTPDTDEVERTWDLDSVPPPDLPFPLEEAFASPDNARAFREVTQEWLKERSREVEAILLDYEAFDFIANFTFKELSRDSETYSEPTHEGMAAIVEYITLLYLKHPYNHSQKLVIPAHVLAEGRQRLMQIIGALQMAHRMDSWLIAETEKEHARMEEAFRQEDEILAEAEVLRQSKPEPADEQDEEDSGRSVARKLSAFEPERAKEELRVRLFTWVTNFLGTGAFVITAPDLAAHIGLSVEKVEAVLDFFKLEFGSIPADWHLLQPAHPLRTHPFLHHEGHYLYPLPGTLIWGVREHLEATLNPDSPDHINSPSTIIGHTLARL